jgi:hypothetical protein
MLEKGNVLFYSFVNDDFILKFNKKTTIDASKLENEIIDNLPDIAQAEPEIEEELEELGDDDDYNPFA